MAKTWRFQTRSVPYCDVVSHLAATAFSLKRAPSQYRRDRGRRRPRRLGGRCLARPSRTSGRCPRARPVSRASTSASRCWRRSTTCSARSAPRALCGRRAFPRSSVRRSCRPTAASNATQTSPARQVFVGLKPGRFPARRLTTCCSGTRQQVAPRFGSVIACWTCHSTLTASRPLVQESRRRRSSSGRTRPRHHRCVRSWGAAFTQVRPAHRRAASRQHRGVLALRRRAKQRRPPRWRYPYRGARRPRMVLADPDLRRLDERRRRAAADRRAGPSGLSSLAPCSSARSRKPRRWHDSLPAARREWPARVEKDFSFGSRAYAGDRWVLAGDAGSFLDPVFSTGVAIALESGLEAAQAVAAGSRRRRSVRSPVRPLRATPATAVPVVPTLRARVLHAGVPGSVLRRAAAPSHVPVARHGLRRLLAAVARDAPLGALFFLLVRLQRWVRFAPPMSPARSRLTSSGTLQDDDEHPEFIGVVRASTPAASLRRRIGPPPTIGSASSTRCSNGRRRTTTARAASCRSALAKPIGVRRSGAPDLCAGMRVLDVGTGTGLLACEVVHVLGAVGHVVGVDPSPQMMAVGRRHHGIRFVQSLGECLPFPDSHFDPSRWATRSAMFPTSTRPSGNASACLSLVVASCCSRSRGPHRCWVPGAGACCTSGTVVPCSHGSAQEARTRRS